MKWPKSEEKLTFFGVGEFGCLWIRPQSKLRGAALIEGFLPFRQNFVATLLFSQGRLLDSTTYPTASSAWFKRYLVEPIGDRHPTIVKKRMGASPSLRWFADFHIKVDVRSLQAKEWAHANITPFKQRPQSAAYGAFRELKTPSSGTLCRTAYMTSRLGGGAETTTNSGICVRTRLRRQKPADVMVWAAVASDGSKGTMVFIEEGVKVNG